MPSLAAQGATPWYDIGWAAWLGLWIGVIGFGATLWGLWITWKTAKAAKDAADLARAAVENTQRKLRAAQLLVLVPQLRWISQALEESIDLDEPLVTRKHLDYWKFAASNVRGILSDSDDAERILRSDLKNSVALAFAANTALAGAAGKRTVLSACKHARAAISDICVELTTWAGAQSWSVKAEGVDDVGE